MDEKARNVFEEDDVVDWFLELQDSGGSAKFVKATMKELLASVEAEEYFDRYSAGRAIALAEWIASIRGHKHVAASPYVDELLTRKRSLPTEELIQQLIPMLRTIAEESEVKELWEEAGLSLEWKQSIGDLMVRLSCLPTRAPLQKAIRFRTGDIFKISLADSQVSYGIVLDHSDRFIKVFGAHIELAAVKSGPFTLDGFSVLLLQGPLETGTWPIVAKATGLKSNTVKSVLFGQDDYTFRIVAECRGRKTPVRECLNLEKSSYWHPSDIVERIVSGECSDKLYAYWPRCIDENGELQPKCWKKWTEEDFQRMEAAQRMQEPGSSFWQ